LPFLFSPTKRGDLKMVQQLNNWLKMDQGLGQVIGILLLIVLILIILMLVTRIVAQTISFFRTQMNSNSEKKENGSDNIPNEKLPEDSPDTSKEDEKDLDKNKELPEEHKCSSNETSETKRDIETGTEQNTSSNEENVSSLNIEKKLCDIGSDIANIKIQTENIFSELERDKHLQGHIDKLYAENKIYKEGISKKILMPLVKEIIDISDNYSMLYKNHSKNVSEINTTKLLEQFGKIASYLEKALYKNGIETYYSKEGTAVDFNRQEPIETSPTNDPKKDNTVRECIKKGFILDNVIVRQEQISCYVYENNQSPTNKE
jgi:molecular chaperone GrpE (heat shock protein)